MRSFWRRVPKPNPSQLSYTNSECESMSGSRIDEPSQYGLRGFHRGDSYAKIGV